MKRLAVCCGLAVILVVATPWGQANDTAQIGLLWGTTATDESSNTAARKMEECLASHIREAAPEFALVRTGPLRDALYPLLEPGTQPRTEEEFAALLARGDVRERLAERGLRYLVALTGGTAMAKTEGFVLCGAGYGGGGCLGFAWQDQTTAVDAALWSLGDGAVVPRREAAKAEGTNLFPAFGLPVRIRARTVALACHDLAPRIVSSIRQAEQQRLQNR